MYSILTTGLKNVKVVINVDKVPALRHPKSILAGGGSLVNKYTKYLEEHGFEDVSLLRVLAHIHNVGKEKGEVGLKCDCMLGKRSHKEAHSDVIKDFIQRYEEQLDALLPYLFTNQVFTPKTEEEINKDLSKFSETTKAQLVKNYETTKLLYGKLETHTEVQLSDEDRKQISALIEQDQAKSVIETLGNNENSVEEPTDAIGSFKNITAEELADIQQEQRISAAEAADFQKQCYGEFKDLPDPQTVPGQTVVVERKNLHVPDSKKFFTRLDKEESTNHTDEAIEAQDDSLIKEQRSSVSGSFEKSTT